VADETEAEIEVDEEEGRPEGVPDLSNPRQQRDTKRRLKALNQERAETLRNLLSTPNGRRLFAWIIHDLGGLYRPVANQAFDAQALHFKEGARALAQVLHDYALQEARPQYIVLLGETLPNR
jgi:hypothetical protein